MGRNPYLNPLIQKGFGKMGKELSLSVINDWNWRLGSGTKNNFMKELSLSVINDWNIFLGSLFMYLVEKELSLSVIRDWNLSLV